MAARLTAYLVVAIVAGTFIAGLIVGAQRDDNEGPVDLIVQNGIVYSADGRGARAEAVAVRGNRILRVGTAREIARLQQRQTQVIDARGGAVLPGFNDAHLQFGQGALTLGTVDLTGAATVSDVLARIGAWSTAHPDAEWISGRGWSPGAFRPGTPWRQVIDSVVPDRPVLLHGTDGASALANSTALRLAGVSRTTPDPAGGTIVRDARGEPSGLLRGIAAERVARLAPPPPRTARRTALLAAMQQANALGITSIHTVDDQDWLEAYEELRRRGELTIRTYLATPLTQPLSEQDLRPLREARARHLDDPLVKAGALVVHVDGEATARTAALLGPYAGEGAAGHLRLSADDLNRTVRIADAAGWQVIADASGDRAVRVALDAFTHAARSNDASARARRHRIHRAVLVDPADAPRFGALGVVASMQPARAGLGAAGDDLIPRLGPVRAARAYAFRTLAAESRLVFGSGWPSSALGPLEGLKAATTRPPVSRGASESPSERLSLTEAIEAYTWSGAWASFDEQRKGAITPGMLADLVVLTDDIFAAPEALAETAVAFTIFDGRVVYERPAPASTTE